MTIRISRPSPAMIVAVLALIVAMSGSAYAIQRAQSGDSLIAQRTLSGNRLRLNTVTGNEIVNVVWHNLTLINGWENYNTNQRPPGWAIDVQGFVRFRGAIQQTTGSNAIFARLPVGARPSEYVYLPADLNGADQGRIYIATNGSMYAQAAVLQSSAQSFTSLDGISYWPH